ncbi:MAG: glutamate-5-semialdehyde dehydrogenase [Acholeplasmatales bacterium]|nr:glutamate-5-semialdehyde dehydrogenase [Acholeplasmatales bacterium]
MDELLKRCKNASFLLDKLDDNEKNNLIIKMAEAVLANSKSILEANKLDIENAKKNGLKESMIERLTLTEKRIKDLYDSAFDLIKLKSPVGEIIEDYKTANGLNIKKIRVPFGVICAIFESRPNVAFDISILTLKAGSACVLKGGKEAINTNKALVNTMKDAIKDYISPDVITLIESTSREDTNYLITKKEYIDLLIPRGSKNLINYICENAKVPFIETGAGNCHLYVHEKADIEMAIKIAINAKYQRPSVCNAIENIVVDRNIKEKFLKRLYEEFSKLNIEMRGDEEVLEIINVNKATDEDYYQEYNDYIVAIKVVSNIDEAISFINSHSTKHSEAIITNDINAKNQFFKEIDSACVYHNASTRFTDGGCFGFGAEIGISTTKLHARGPMGIKEITTYKYIISGNGEIR